MKTTFWVGGFSLLRPPRWLTAAYCAWLAALALALRRRALAAAAGRAHAAGLARGRRGLRGLRDREPALLRRLGRCRRLVSLGLESVARRRRPPISATSRDGAVRPPAARRGGRLRARGERRVVRRDVFGVRLGDSVRRAMSWLDAAILGLIQGLTEFIPVSSDGHLSAAEMLMPGFGQVGLLFDVMVHVGTLTAIVIYYRELLARGGRPASSRPTRRSGAAPGASRCSCSPGDGADGDHRPAPEALRRDHEARPAVRRSDGDPDRPLPRAVVLPPGGPQGPRHDAVPRRGRDRRGAGLRGAARAVAVGLDDRRRAAPGARGALGGGLHVPAGDSGDRRRGRPRDRLGAPAPGAGVLRARPTSASTCSAPRSPGSRAISRSDS